MITLDTSYLNAFLIAVVVVCVLFVIRGAHRGLVSSLIHLFGSIAAGLLAWMFCPVLSKRVEILPKSEYALLLGEMYSYLNQIVWFVILFFGLLIVFGILAKVFENLHLIPGLKQVGSILGGLVGFIQGFILVCLLGVLLQTPIFSNGKEIVNHSILSPILEVGESLYSTFILPIDTKEFSDTQKLALDQWLQEQGY